MEKNFHELYLEGKVTIDDIDDFIENWHNGDGEGLELHEYLGLTEEQYSHFVQHCTLD